MFLPTAFDHHVLRDQRLSSTAACTQRRRRCHTRNKATALAAALTPPFHKLSAFSTLQSRWGICTALCKRPETKRRRNAVTTVTEVWLTEHRLRAPLSPSHQSLNRRQTSELQTGGMTNSTTPHSSQCQSLTMVAHAQKKKPELGCAQYLYFHAWLSAV